MISNDKDTPMLWESNCEVGHTIFPLVDEPKQSKLLNINYTNSTTSKENK